MKKFLRFLRLLLLGLLAFVALAGALFGYFLYSPEPDPSKLTGAVDKGKIEVGGLTRKYRSYIPRNLAKNAPLLLVLHGSGMNGAQIRVETGYGFDRLADRHGFAVVYPDAASFDWNDCSLSSHDAVWPGPIWLGPDKTMPAPMPADRIDCRHPNPANQPAEPPCPATLPCSSLPHAMHWTAGKRAAC